MAENNLIGGVNQLGGANYPTFQPMPQPGGMGQLNDMLSLARNAQGLQQQQFELGQKRTMFVADRLGSLLTKPDLSITDAQDMVGDMVRNQIIPASEAPAILQHFPQDPTQLRAAVKQSYLSTLDHTNRMGLAYGVPGQQSLGDIVQPTMREVTSGVVRPTGPSYSMGLTPESKVQRQPAISGGLPVSIPIGSQFNRTGDYAPAAPQQGAGAAANMAPRGMASSALPPGTMQAGQGPGTEASASASASSDAQRATAFEDAASRVNDSKAILDRMDANAVNFTGGPASPLLKKAGGYVNQIATGLGLPAPVGSQASREAFDKDAALLAGQQSSALGNTDAAKSLASVMTPGSSNTNEGIRNIAAVLKGNQDAIAAKGQAWNAYKNSLPTGTARFSDFENQFNTHFSPRAFAMPYMSQAERQKMWNNMSETEQAQVKRSYDEAKAKGYLGGSAGTAPSP